MVSKEKENEQGIINSPFVVCIEVSSLRDLI